MIKKNYPPPSVLSSQQTSQTSDLGELFAALLQYLKFPAVTSLGVFCPELVERAENC